ncbi:hypothetical protein AAGS40_16260 [Paraburkholderia sp. PREW-6R]|uniref:hypothetical protein n=1 Tax=Paraburkholderia sp. PREW-6R TaxID=3141544 RepID=UPI0031F54514
MKIFLISDLVVQELASMRVDGKWLSREQFVESALFWISRYAPRLTLPEAFFNEIERDALQIAAQLAEEQQARGEDSSLEQLFGDYPAVNYAHPLNARALAATLAACRDKLARNNGAISLADAVWARQFAVCTKSTPRPPCCHSASCARNCDIAQRVNEADTSRTPHTLDEPTT